jgi:hypothetical protein
MAKFIITNAFSLNMLRHDDGGRMLKIVPINARAAHNLVVNMYAESAIGHPDTALIVANLLGLPEKADEWAKAAEERKNVYVPPLRYCERSEIVSLIVAQYHGPRLQSGATELPDGATIEFWQVYEA